MQATARAPSNIALIKYWGKRDIALNLPATGSISVTLDALATTTTVVFDEARASDEIRLNGMPAGPAARRITRFLDLIRSEYGVTAHAHVETENDFPTGAGLASSASGFAALALACNEALDLGLTRYDLSALARRGSGSAARSLIGGFAEMLPGTADDGSDAYAIQLADPGHVPLTMLIAITSRSPKAVGSTEGMQRTQRTSPYHPAWVEATTHDLDAMRDAIGDAVLEEIGLLAESNCLRMHASMLGARPPLLYWNPATVAVMRAVWDLREEGCGAWFTIDAGPQVKVICAPQDTARVEGALRATAGVTDVLAAEPGEGARIVATAP
jgi:diphosphomevalonate decarboxylase